MRIPNSQVLGLPASRGGVRGILMEVTQPCSVSAMTRHPAGPLGCASERHSRWSGVAACVKCMGTQVREPLMPAGRISHMDFDLSAGSDSVAGAVKVCSPSNP